MKPLTALLGIAAVTGFGTLAYTQDVDQAGNLGTFARVYGYVRFFHPSDEAAGADWNALAVHGAHEVMRAASTRDLQAALERVFLPIAPTMRLYDSTQPAPPPPQALAPADTTGLDPVAWQHLGVGLGQANNIYRSIRINRPAPIAASTFAALTQGMDATPYRGRRIRLTGMGRVADSNARVQLWLRVDLADGGRGFFDNMGDRPVRSAAWTGMTVTGPVATNALRIVFGAIVSDGTALVDDLRLEAEEDGGRWVAVPLVNGGFEDGEAGRPVGWLSASPGWSYQVAPDDAAPGGERTLRIGTADGDGPLATPLFSTTPEPGEVIRRDVGRGLSIQLPLALYSRDGHTLGAPDPSSATSLSAALSSASDRIPAGDPARRVADIIVAWNVLQHFYPYFDVVDTDWQAVLKESLQRSLAGRTADDFAAALEWLVSELEDGHGMVAGVRRVSRGQLPVRVEWIEDQVVVVASRVEDIRLGDVIERLGDEDAREVVNEAASRTSGSERWRRWRVLPTFGAGDEGSVATLRVRGDGGSRTVEVTRTAEAPPPEDRPDPIAEIGNGISYVDLSRATIEAFRARAPELAAAAGVIFDLRGYPNGTHLALTYLTDQPLQSAFWRVPQIIRPDREGDPSYRESRWNLPPSQPRFGGRIVFLTDGRAISYAESVMGIVEHYELGEIVGEATAGANGNVNVIPLPSGARIAFTGMRVVKHDGSQHHLVGIQPTVPLSRTIAGVRAGRDELLERAMTIVTGGGRIFRPGAR